VLGEGDRFANQQLSFRSRIKGRFIEREFEAPELALADDAAHGFTRETALRRALEGRRPISGNLLALTTDERHGVEAEGELRDEAGIELGRVEPGFAESVAHLPPGNADGNRRAQLIPSMAASCAA
jgi:hypothetical protein